ncbi:unnamed protein product [Calypogeia fissa]
MASSREEQPPSKKRVALRQISKDDDPDSEEEEGASIPGTFRRASDQVLAERRIVKVRRTPAAPSSAPNPFSGIRLVAPTTSVPPQVASVGPPSTLNPNASPFAPIVRDGEIEVPSTGAVVQIETTSADNQQQKEDVVTGDGGELQIPKTGKVEEVETNSGASHAIAQDVVTDLATEKRPDVTDEAKPNGDEEVKARSTESSAGPSGNETSSVTFEQLSTAKNAFAGSFGTSFSSSSSAGNNSSMSQASSGFAFGQPFTFGSQSSGTGLTFGFGQSQALFASKPGSQGAFPSVASVFGTSNGSGQPSFGSSFPSSAAAPPKPPIVSLQEIQVETGEEKEKAIFTADATLFEFLDGGWKERGKGELKLNVSEEKDKRPRLVMRAKGNYRLLLNASLFPDMKVSKMDNRGITFACVNSAAEGKTGLTTYAVRLKDGVVAAEFRATVEAHKGDTPKGEARDRESRKVSATTEPRTPESSPKSSERPSKISETRDVEA